MRWHPPTVHVPRVIVWRIQRNGRKWDWAAFSRNGRMLAVSVESFSSRAQCLRAAILFGRPKTFAEFNAITALHDGHLLVTKWSDPA